MRVCLIATFWLPNLRALLSNLFEPCCDTIVSNIWNKSSKCRASQALTLCPPQGLSAGGLAALLPLLFQDSAALPAVWETAHVALGWVRLCRTLEDASQLGLQI